MSRLKIKRWSWMLLAVILVLAGCNNSNGNKESIVIDWVNFIKFNGILYTANQYPTEHALSQDDLGPQVETVNFEVASNVKESGYEVKDGDAAFYEEGTAVYEVKGYSPSFRLAILDKDQVVLFEADTNPRATKGSDLLDIEGKVEYIGINSEQDGTTELAAIRDQAKLQRLVDLVAKANIDQEFRSDGERYFIAFHLQDGTSVIRAFWLESGELSRGIMLPPAFVEAVKNTLNPPKISIGEAGQQVLQVLAANSFEQLSEWIDPEEGVRLSPYAYVQIEGDQVFTADQIKHAADNSQQYDWGYYDGSGEPMVLTVEEYFEQFVYDHDYLQAPQTSVNSRIGQSNTLNNIAEVYPPGNHQFVEYHFPGFEEQYEGIDWSSLRLVFKESGNTFKLVGIVHDQWTV